MKSPDVLTGDELLYSVHRSLRVNKPHLGNPLRDVQFILFPRAFCGSITRKFDKYKSIAKTEGSKLTGYMGLPRVEAIHFSNFFSIETVRYSSIELCEEMVSRYFFLKTRLIQVIDEGFIKEEHAENPFAELEKARQADDEDEEELTAEESKQIDTETDQFFTMILGVDKEHREQWLNTLSAAGRSLSTTFLRPTLDLSRAKSQMEFYQRQLQPLRIPK